MVPFGFRVSVWSVIGPDFGTKSRSEDAVPERLVPLDRICANRPGSRHCSVGRFRNEPASHSAVVTPVIRASWPSASKYLSVSPRSMMPGWV